MSDRLAGRSPGALELLRHALATLAYRGGKAVRGAPDSFAAFHLAATSRTPVQILAHIGDLLDWALSLARGAEAWHESPPRAWPDEVSRFYDALARLDAQLAAHELVEGQRRSSCCRARSPTRSRTSASSRCCAGWRAPRSAARTTCKADDRGRPRRSRAVAGAPRVRCSGFPARGSSDLWQNSRGLGSGRFAGVPEAKAGRQRMTQSSHRPGPVDACRAGLASRPVPGAPGGPTSRPRRASPRTSRRSRTWRWCEPAIDADDAAADGRAGPARARTALDRHAGRRAAAEPRARSRRDRSGSCASRARPGRPTRRSTSSSRRSRRSRRAIPGRRGS